MKYFKFTQISEETGISWAIAQPRSGPSWPKLSGLNSVVLLSYDSLFAVGKTDDTVEENRDNYLIELTSEEYALELKKHVEHKMGDIKNSMYREEQQFRKDMFAKYDQTASMAGIYKYEQAKELVNDSNAAAPEVRLEAQIRNITPLQMANRIIDNHEAFREKEAKIAGLRGMILDRIESYVFDLSDPEGSLQESERRETIGTEMSKEFRDGEFVSVEIDVKVPYYSLFIETRYKFL